MNDSSQEVITSTMMPEVEIDDTTPGELVLVQQGKTAEDNPNPLIFFMIFLPFIFLGAIAIVTTVKLLQWGQQQYSENQTNAPVAAAYSQMNKL
ncbi:hypothetical protein [[Limnothrix rosea] IAM M-220]|uniref:hypothetical protein n=1 Tax=[Limnothrix rosea] IAM M-220 TaxID=454133 RepID=UPI00096834EC|nr:hypothetical protein [[Limnothrix rosea] IAM M-220]OKH12489.1 hypothetical protein NIES208_16095 [[Limnothrix rosea] IAM M-220]